MMARVSNGMQRSVVPLGFVLVAVARIEASPFLVAANFGDTIITQVDLATGDNITLAHAGNRLIAPIELAIDSDGNLYVGSATISSTILKLTRHGNLSTFVNGDGILNEVNGLAMGPQGHLFIANDTTMFRFNPTTSNLSPFGDVRSVNPSLVNVEDIVFDHNGNLYAAANQGGQGTGEIVRFDSAGNATTFASGLDLPRDLTVDSAGRLYSVNNISGEGSVERFDLDSGKRTLFADLSGLFPRQRGIATDLENNVYVVNTRGDIRKWTSAGVGGNIEYHAGTETSRIEALVFSALRFTPVIPEPATVAFMVSGIAGFLMIFGRAGVRRAA
jgi:sugar lactone lactonase YvrE